MIGNIVDFGKLQWWGTMLGRSCRCEVQGKILVVERIWLESNKDFLMTVWSPGCGFWGEQRQFGVIWCFDYGLSYELMAAHIYILNCCAMIYSGYAASERAASRNDNFAWQGNGGVHLNKNWCYNGVRLCGVWEGGQCQQ